MDRTNNKILFSKLNSFAHCLPFADMAHGLSSVFGSGAPVSSSLCLAKMAALLSIQAVAGLARQDA